MSLGLDLVDELLHLQGSSAVADGRSHELDQAAHLRLGAHQGQLGHDCAPLLVAVRMHQH